MERMNKVAQITLLFWIMKILATTLGETLGDLFSMTLGWGYTASLIITMAFFVVVLVIQLLSRKYHAAVYWMLIVGTTTAGTEVSDFMDRTLGLGYTAGSAILIGCLLLVLVLWHLREKKITFYPISSLRVESFYWIAILFSNSLGTAFGDFLSDDLNLSYIGGALVTAAIIAIVIALHYLTRINEVLLFWIAFIFTRPFGATFGDLLTKPVDKGGLDLGTIPASLVTAGLLLGLIIFSIIRQRQKPEMAE